MFLSGENVLSVNEIVEKYQVPQKLAEFYIKQSEFFYYYVIIEMI